MLFWVSAVAWMGPISIILFAAGIGDALVGKGHYPKDDESDSNKRYRMVTQNIFPPFLEPKWLIHSITPSEESRAPPEHSSTQFGIFF